MTNAMPAVNINPDQEEHAAGSLTGQAVLTTGGGALGTINVYDRKGQTVRSVRKGLGGHIEDVRTSYTFTGAVDTVRVSVKVGYGETFTATTVNTYGKGKRTGMTLSVSHGLPAVSRQTEYTYDAVGRLSAKERQLTGTVTSPCTFSYDVHGWLTGVTSGGFEERLHYADGIDGGRWNGNVSTMRWKCTGDSVFQGYNLTYDGANRLCGAVYGTGNNLSGLRDRFSEYADYDCNGNVTWLRRSGFTNNMRESYGLVDALRMTYEGNRLVSVRDSVFHIPYAGASDFTGLLGQENPLTYDESGSLFSDVGRRIARIDYDPRNNPVRIQFTDGSVTGYIYSAAGEKLRVIHQTAVPNISVPVGFIRPLAPSEILNADSTDYLLGGALTLKNGLIDKYLFGEGYCQATVYGFRPGKDSFAFCYYDRDHLGSVREVTRAFEYLSNGTAYLRTDYYPSGLRLCDGTADSGTQPYKYNGKELDGMHGLCTYDYGARQYDPATARWDRTDPLSEKYYAISPYAYCGNNPVNYVDENGDSVRMIFNKDINELQILDMDYYNPNKKLEYVSYKDYKVGKENQVLVIPFVFSGGEIGADGNVVVNPEFRESEISLPNGVYDILDNPFNVKHSTWYRLDKVDNSRYNDKDDITGRDGFRLHLGTRSFGCVTINEKQNNANAIWNVLTGIMGRTNTKKVKEERGMQWLNPFSRRTWYGQMTVIGGK